MRVTSREYKVIVDSASFVDPDSALGAILDDSKEIAQSLGVSFTGAFDAAEPKERTILFLDTPDFTLRQNGLLLRQRTKRKSGKTDYTLKVRTEDRYIAAGRDLRVGSGLQTDIKFEEDIGAPFVSRFSHSTTVTLNDHNDLAGEKAPTMLVAAAKLFPGLLTIQRDGLLCAPETVLTAVHGRTVFERVFLGPTLHLPTGQRHAATKPATIALILWSKGKKGRPLIAEFSFRYSDENEAFPLAAALAAKRFFERLQSLDWVQPVATTKTQYMYGSR